MVFLYIVKNDIVRFDVGVVAQVMHKTVPEASTRTRASSVIVHMGVRPLIYAKVRRKHSAGADPQLCRQMDVNYRNVNKLAD